jgi:hypothetical protein
MEFQQSIYRREDMKERIHFRMIVLSMLFSVLLFWSFGCEVQSTEPLTVKPPNEIISFAIVFLNSGSGDTVMVEDPPPGTPSVTRWIGHIDWSDSTFVIDSVWTEVPY